MTDFLPYADDIADMIENNPILSELINFNSLEEREVPTYDEWLANIAKSLQGHPVVIIGRAVFHFIRSLNAREQAFFDVMESKGLWSAESTERLEARQREIGKNLDKQIVKKAIQDLVGNDMKIPLPDGRQVETNPDELIGLISEVFMEEAEISPGSINLADKIMGGGESLKKRYESEISVIQAQNNLIKALKSARPDTEDQDYVQRDELVSKYLVYCRLNGIAEPSEEELQRMRDGEVPIPDFTGATDDD